MKQLNIVGLHAIRQWPIVPASRKIGDAFTGHLIWILENRQIDSYSEGNFSQGIN